MGRANWNSEKPPVFFCVEPEDRLVEKQLTCVFCGSDDLRFGGNSQHTYVCCPKCGADGPTGEGNEQAIMAYLQGYSIPTLSAAKPTKRYYELRDAK